MLDHLLTIQQLSEQTGIPEETLRKYRLADKGPESFKLHGRIVYKPDAIERWIDSQVAKTKRGG